MLGQVANYQIIGHLRTPFTDNFGVPRQAGLVNTTADLILYPPYDNVEALLGMEKYSHVWVIFLFHQNLTQGWKAKVRPPRLGGNSKLGVFATRSPYRPNHIGMSACKLMAITAGRLVLQGLDCLNDTPVLDIKPYIPYSDCIVDATSELIDRPIAPLQVQYSAKALQQLASITDIALKALIDETLAFDCRPAYKQGKEDNKIYANQLYHYDIHWQVIGNTVQVLEIL